MATPTIKSFERSMNVLQLVLNEREPVEIERVCREVGVPMSTAYRYLTTLARSGLVFRARPGVYLPNPAFLRDLARFDANAILIGAARPVLLELGRRLGTTVHFGVLEDDMVNYIVKVIQEDDTASFTRENQRLEAYCSAIGKVLLAGLQVAEREAYLSSDSFPGLTEKTLTEPDDIRAELLRTAAQEYGVDDGEIDPALFCLAVPVRDGCNRLLGAISASFRQREQIVAGREARLANLRDAAEKIGGIFGGD
ncbi:MAG: IclR family transcriptional regulator [Hyphomonadaceae bacterium]|nr:IclR family transcriptional regulator [Hyphomonadaceae bacterium]